MANKKNTMRITYPSSEKIYVPGEINKIKDLVNVPIVLTSPVVRIYFKKLIDQFYPNVTVVSFSEIDNNIQIQALGNIALGQR